MSLPHRINPKVEITARGRKDKVRQKFESTIPSHMIIEGNYYANGRDVYRVYDPSAALFPYLTFILNASTGKSVCFGYPTEQAQQRDDRINRTIYLTD